MATTITNRIGVSTIQGDTTNDAISFANLKHADEATPVAAKIVEIFWDLKLYPLCFHNKLNLE